MGQTRHLKGCGISHIGYDKEWTPNTISSRVSANGGSFQGDRIRNKTTHLVVTPKAWKAQGPIIKEALSLNQEGNREIKIVSFDWLEDSWRNGLKSTRPYEWLRLNTKVKNGGETGQPTQAPEVETPKSTVGMMAGVLEESTDKFLDASDKKRIAREVETTRRIQQEMENERLEEKKKEIEKQSYAYQKGAKKARNEIFTENHHIYADVTGFKYDVLLTKIDAKHNRNERWALTLQIYESNAEPHTYAMNTQFAGTGTRPSNNLIIAIGSNFPTALRAFKKAFMEKTEVSWDQRISFALERSQREKRARVEGARADSGARGDGPASLSETTKDVRNDKDDFATAPFQYHPPSYGPKGILNDDEKALIAEIAPAGAKSGSKENETAKPDQGIANGAGLPATGFSKNTGLASTADAGAMKFDFETAVDSVHGQPIPSTNCLPVSSDFDTLYPDCLPEHLQYPFNNTEIGAADGDISAEHGQESFEGDSNSPPTTEQGMQDVLDGNNNVSNFPEQGMQDAGETQLAEKVHNELLEDGNDLQEESPHAGPFTVDLGASMLGKRKVSMDEDSTGYHKAIKSAEVQDSFQDEILEDADFA